MKHKHDELNIKLYLNTKMYITDSKRVQKENNTQPPKIEVSTYS